MARGEGSSREGTHREPNRPSPRLATDIGKAQQEKS